MGATPTIQGLPAGASVSPIQGLPPGATTSPIQGMPAGASAQPVGAASDQGADGHWYDGAVNAAKAVGSYEKDALQGFGQSAAAAVGGIADYAVKGPGKLAGKDGPNLGSLAPLALIPGYDKVRGALQAEADKPLDTFAKKHGAMLENIIEFAGGEEGLKGMSVADATAHLGKIASTLKKSPRIVKVLDTAIKQGLLGSTQGVAHGENASQALQSGAVAGIGGGVLEGAGQSLGKGVEAIRPGTRSIGGVDVPTLASQEPGASAAAASAADIRSTPEFQGAQQAAGGKVVAKTAQQAAQDSIERLNQTRVRPLVTDPARMLPAPEGMKPFEFTMDGAEPTESVTNGPQTGGRDYYEGAGSRAYQSTPPPSGEGSVTRGGGGTRTFTDPGEANAALSHYQQIMDSDAFESMSPRQQSKIQAQADSLRDQLDTHGAYRARASHFEPVDAAAATRNVESFHDAAQQVEGSVSDVYSKLDSLSDNTWRDLRKQEVGTRKMIRNTTSPDSLDAAQGRLADIQKQQSDIFEANKDQISPDEWRAANAAWKDASTMRDIHDAVQGSFKGAPADVKARNPNLYRELKGDRLTGRLNTLLDKRGEDVDRVLGTAGKDSLYQLGDLLKKPEGVQGATGRVKAMAMAARRHGHTIGGLAGGALGFHLGGYGGAAALGVLGATGEMATEHAYRRAVNAIATRPELARRLIYATKNNVAPHIAGPLLASMMIRDDADQQQSQ